MMAWLRRIFHRPPPDTEDYYERLHDASVNARAQMAASERATRRVHARRINVKYGDLNRAAFGRDPWPRGEESRHEHR